MGKRFTFHSYLEISCHKVKHFCSYYQEILKNRGTITYAPHYIYHQLLLTKFFGIKNKEIDKKPL